MKKTAGQMVREMEGMLNGLATEFERTLKVDPKDIEDPENLKVGKPIVESVIKHLRSWRYDG